MLTKVSTKGRVFLPDQLRRRLGIRAGDLLDASIESGRIVLKPPPTGSRRAEIVTDPVTGLPVLSTGPGAPLLTSKDVKKILTTFW